MHLPLFLIFEYFPYDIILIYGLSMVGMVNDVELLLVADSDFGELERKDVFAFIFRTRSECFQGEDRDA